MNIPYSPDRTVQVPVIGIKPGAKLLLEGSLWARITTVRDCPGRDECPARHDANCVALGIETIHPDDERPGFALGEVHYEADAIVSIAPPPTPAQRIAAGLRRAADRIENLDLPAVDANIPIDYRGIAHSDTAGLRLVNELANAFGAVARLTQGRRSRLVWEHGMEASVTDEVWVETHTSIRSETAELLLKASDGGAP
jgi:hypothetical protein